MMTRRGFLKGAAAGAAGAAVMPGLVTAARAAGPKPRIRVSSCSVGGLTAAKKAGLDGAEVNVGGPADTLQIADPAVRRRYKDEMKATGLEISSFMMGLFNGCPLASDPRGPAWLDQSIEAGGNLGADVLLLAFFGKGSLKSGSAVKKADVDVVVERIKAAAPKAKGAGVILGIENTLSAEDNMKILDRIGHDSVRIYYDCYNLAGQGYDVPAEIRLLKDKIAIFHFKNGRDYLETGKVKWDPIVAAMNDIGYKGWIVLETSSPSKDRIADARRNADYVRKLFGVKA